MTRPFKLSADIAQGELIVLYAPHRAEQALAFADAQNCSSFVIRPQQSLDLSELDEEHQVALVFDDKVYLQAVGKKAPGPVDVSFEGNSMVHRLNHGGGKGEQVAKAVGLGKLPKGKTLSVIDATAGLGRDSLILAALHCEIQMYERNPSVRELLKDGLERASLSGDVAVIAKRMTLNLKDFLDASGTIEDESVDVVYLDPMFPDRTKSALVKKEMRVFKQLIGGDDDADQLFEPAYRIAKHRVVVKRPKAAPFLAGKTPSVQIKGKSGRFDIYTKKAFS
jgi:16S rRNA (guanine1516-N2)-methyltransferase